MLSAGSSSSPPAFFSSSSFKRHADIEEEEEKNAGGDDDEPAESIYGTLTRSLKETKLITTITECEVDDEELLKKMEITKNQTPAQLAEIKSIKDIPVPDKIKHLLDRPAKLAEGDEKAGGGNDDDDEPAESIYSTLTRSLKETKLVTTITECEVDDEELLKKMEITKNQTPIQLAEIKSIKDIP